MLQRISIITTCYNIENFIGDTLSSVLSQQYPNLQYIVLDGASTDGTLDIVRNYSKNISTIISEPDNGQYFAIQKGFELSNGEIMAWLNADDTYLPWTFSVVSEIFDKFPTVDWIIGLPTFLNRKGQCIKVSDVAASYPRTFIANGWYRGHLMGYLQQESMFWRRSLWEKSGGLDLKLNYAADFKLWTKFAKYAELVAVSVPLSAFRYRPDEQKSSTGITHYESEVSHVCKDLPPPPLIWDKIASQGVRLRSLCRLAAWKKSPVIAYSNTKNTWVLINSRRPVSRASFAGLLVESSLR